MRITASPSCWSDLQRRQFHIQRAFFPRQPDKGQPRVANIPIKVQKCYGVEKKSLLQKLGRYLFILAPDRFSTFFSFVSCFLSFLSCIMHPPTPLVEDKTASQIAEPHEIRCTLPEPIDQNRNRAVEPGATDADQTVVNAENFVRRRSHTAPISDVVKSISTFFRRPSSYSYGPSIPRLNEKYGPYVKPDRRSPTHRTTGATSRNNIASGATAVIRLVQDRQNRILAVKEFKKKDKTEDEREYLRRMHSEYCISKSVSQYKHIVITLDLVMDEQNRWCAVMEYVCRGVVDIIGYGAITRKMKTLMRLLLVCLVCRRRSLCIAEGATEPPRHGASMPI